MKIILTFIPLIFVLSVFGQKTIKSYTVFQYSIETPSDSTIVYHQENDINGNKLVTISYNQGDLYMKENWEYDSNFNIISHFIDYSNGSTKNSTFSYNKFGEKVKEINQTINNENIYSDTIAYTYNSNNLITQLKYTSYPEKSNDHFIIYNYNQNDSLIEETKYKVDSTILLQQLFKYSENGKLLGTYYFNPNVTQLGDTTTGEVYRYDNNDNLIEIIRKDKFKHINNYSVRLNTTVIKYRDNNKVEEINYYNDSCITSIKKYDKKGLLFKYQSFWYCDSLEKIEYEKEYKKGVLILDINYHSDGGIKSKKVYNNFGNLTESIEYIFEVSDQGAIRYVNEYGKKNRLKKQLYYVKVAPKGASWSEISKISAKWKDEKPKSTQEHFYNVNGDKEKIIYYNSENQIIGRKLFYYQYY